MILEYHRPTSIKVALELLARPAPTTLPLAGGTDLNKPTGEAFAVVDLQDLGLNQIVERGNILEVGATSTLEQLLQHPACPPALKPAIRQEATINLRRVGSVVGTLVAADGRSPLTTAFLALDAVLSILPAEHHAGLGEILPVRTERLRGQLITRLTLPRQANLAYYYASRTPADWPLLCVALARWPSGRLRLAIGGFGSAPTLAFDGPEAAGLETAAQEACADAGDQWASAEYRSSVAGVLAGRALRDLQPAAGD